MWPIYEYKWRQEAELAHKNSNNWFRIVNYGENMWIAYASRVWHLTAAAGGTRSQSGIGAIISMFVLLLLFYKYYLCECKRTIEGNGWNWFVGKRHYDSKESCINLFRIPWNRLKAASAFATGFLVQASTSIRRIRHALCITGAAFALNSRQRRRQVMHAISCIQAHSCDWRTARISISNSLSQGEHCVLL